MADFIPLNIAVITVSDTRSTETDSSGDLLAKSVADAGHNVGYRCIVVDDIYQIRAALSRLIAEPKIHAVLMTGGTGFSGRDSTPEAVAPLFDKKVEGFGELFREISAQQIGTSTIQSRALAGYANKTIIFCMPGSNNACRTAWEPVIREQLDARTKPCNFVATLLSKHGAH